MQASPLRLSLPFMEQPVSSPDSADPNEVPSEDELRMLCEELGKGWDSTFGSMAGLEMGREDQYPDPVRFPIVYAFAAHAHTLTATACEHLARLDYAAAGALLRVAYESALTAVWAAESEEAARAIHHGLVQDAMKLRANAKKTEWFDDLLGRIPEPAPAPDGTAGSAQGEAATFANLCQSLEPHSDGLYLQFRLLSVYAHPSGEVIKMFVSDDGQTISLGPRDASPDVHLHLWHAAALNLLQAGQALDRLDPSARRREALARAGDRLGWSEPLRLTEKAKSAVKRARIARDAAADEQPLVE